MHDTILTRIQKDRIAELVYPLWMTYRRKKHYPSWVAERGLAGGERPTGPT